MIDHDHDLSITKQAEALNISRGSAYYLPRPVSAADLALMRRIDELHLEAYSKPITAKVRTALRMTRGGLMCWMTRALEPRPITTSAIHVTRAIGSITRTYGLN